MWHVNFSPTVEYLCGRAPGPSCQKNGSVTPPCPHHGHHPGLPLALRLLRFISICDQLWRLRGWCDQLTARPGFTPNLAVYFLYFSYFYSWRRIRKKEKKEKYKESAHYVTVATTLEYSRKVRICPSFEFKSLQNDSFRYPIKIDCPYLTRAGWM